MPWADNYRNLISFARKQYGFETTRFIPRVEERKDFPDFGEGKYERKGFLSGERLVALAMQTHAITIGQGCTL